MADYNITTAVISEGCQRTVASPSLAQWDEGQILMITGVDLPAAFRVEFSHPGDATTELMIGSATDGVEIPNDLLESALPIIAHVVLQESESERETEYWITIYVRARPQPSDPDATPEQLDAIDQAILALNNGVSAAEDAAASASQDAESTDAAATLAQSWAEGGTGTRVGEDVDNAKYYAWLASQGAEESGYVWCEVDLETGNLIVHITTNLDEDLSFEVNENSGELEVTING